MRALESSLELRQAARHGAAARLDLHVVGGGPLEQPLLGVHRPLYCCTVLYCTAVLLLLAGLSQVDQGQHQRQEDDNEGPQQQSYHHPLSVGLLTHPRTVSAHLLSLVLHTAPRTQPRA